MVRGGNRCSAFFGLWSRIRGFPHSSCSNRCSACCGFWSLRRCFPCNSCNRFCACCGFWSLRLGLWVNSGPTRRFEIEWFSAVPYLFFLIRSQCPITFARCRCSACCGVVHDPDVADNLCQQQMQRLLWPITSVRRNRCSACCG